MLENGFDVALLAWCLWCDLRLLGRGLNALRIEVLQSGHAFALDDPQGVREIASTDGRAGFARGFQQLKQLLGALDALFGAFELDPTVARRSLHSQDLFDGVKVLRVVAQELLDEAGVFEVKGFGGHLDG